MVEQLNWDESPKEITDKIEYILGEDGDERSTGKVLEWWLNGFQHPETRIKAREMANVLVEANNNGTWGCKRLFMKPISVAWVGSNATFDLVLTDSIFEPEDWSRTFLEGLLRRPKTSWRNAEVIELGIGSGFISITLCKFLPVKSILGLDLNPVACTAAKLNIMINSFDRDGNVIPSGIDQKPLYEIITCYESDLLQYAIENNVRADAVIGCIPQAMQPDTPDRSMTEILYDLGNYCAVQGLVEDSFGLGLNAAAIDQSHNVLRESGVLVLNLAGRPGRKVVKRMFSRRGLQPKTLWRTRIFQAGDTSVEPLAKLEAETKTDFEFFLHRQSLKSIPARTAAKVLDAGGSVWHELRVFEAEPKLGELWRALVNCLRKLGITGANRDVDLELVDEEQAQFVIALADQFEKNLYLRLPDASGSKSFRVKVASYLNRYAGRNFTLDNVFIGPSRAMTYHSIMLALTKQGDTVLVNEYLEPRLKPVCSELGLEMISCSDSAEEVAELLDLLKPSITVYAVDEGGASLNELRNLVHKAANSNVPLLIDETAIFDITSRATGGGIIGSLSEDEHAHFPIFVIGLEKSTVYPDLNVTIVASENEALHKNLLAAASGTYARISRFHELYFECLFDDMTVFRMWESEDPVHLPGKTEESMATIFLDSGTNKGEMPSFLGKALVQSFLDRSAGRSSDYEEVALKDSIINYIRSTRGLSSEDLMVSLHHGRWPAIYNTFIGLRQVRKKTLRVGVAGPIDSLQNLLQLAGVEFTPLLQPATASFKLTVDVLNSMTETFNIIYITNPSLPSGEIYTKDEIDQIAKWVEANGLWLFVDEGHALLYSEKLIESPLAASAKNHIAIFGGVSREFAVGGLRVGWMVTGSKMLVDAVDAVRLSPLQNFAMRATRLLLGATAEDVFTSGTEVHNFLSDQSTRFRENMQVVRDVFGGAVLFPKEGSKCGLFCVVDLTRVTKSPQEFLDKLREERKVVMKGIPNLADGYVRINLSEKVDVMSEAMKRIKEQLD